MAQNHSTPAKSSALITGATGFIGSNLTRRLLAEGYQVTLLVRPGSTVDETTRARCNVVYGDLHDARALAFAVRDRELIFHCAANVNTWDTPERYYQTNVLGVQNLLDAIVHNNLVLKRFVHLSTVDVYGYPDQPATEETPPRAVGFGYGDSKLQGENRVLQTATAHNLPYTIIRPGNVIGVGSQFIREITKALHQDGMLTIDGGRAHAGLIDVDNLIDLLLWAARSERALNEIYNARDETELDWRTLIQLLQHEAKTDRPVRDLSFRTAITLARLLEFAHSLIGRQSEPKLHRLLVCMFGKTCAHPADKIRSHSKLSSRITIEDSIRRAAQALPGK